jgi:hypothetical protein
LKRRITYRHFLLALSTIVVFYGCNFGEVTKKGKVKIPRLQPKYSYKDKEPMGGYVAYHYLNALFEYGVTDVTNQKFSNLRYQINYNKSLYVIVAKAVYINKADLESMLNYVDNGNTIFISANYVDEKLLDTLQTDMSFDLEAFYGLNEYKLDKRDTWVSLAHETDSAKKYGIYFVPFDQQVRSYDSSATQVLGYNEEKEVNFISIDHGQGKFIIHTSPVAFSNYFLLTGNNREYLEKMFSYFSAETTSVYWDNYYRARRSSDDNFSIFNYFKKHLPLLYAFLIAVALLLIFLAFGGRRRQRFVPEKIPYANSTVSYTETIGRLYLQKKDNRNIALKMVTYFLEHVRAVYYLNTQNLNNEFAEALSRKSGVPEVRVKQLLQIVDETDKSENISDLRLLELHNMIQEYFKK